MKTTIIAFFILAQIPMLISQSHDGESPYFQILSESTAPGSMPLESTSADVTITGPIADVTITQTYTNNGEYPIEAAYVFPASTRAAVYHMEMKIGERTIMAEIKERGEARQTYETAKAEGKRTSLLEQHRPNVFQMEVANILPGETIHVILKYTEFIIPEEQKYSFVYPTVVGPKYVSAPEEVVLVSSVSNPSNIWNNTTKSHVSSYDFDIDVKINMPVPIAELNCKTHNMQVVSASPQSKTMQLDPLEVKGGNRDVIIEYRLAGDEVLTGAMTYDNGDEKFFLCQIEPPSRSSDFEIVPREFIFIVDVSGSMHGFPLEVSKQLMKNLFGSLKPTDLFNVLCFAGNNFTMFERSAPATNVNLRYAFNHLNNMQGSGGTELLPALRSAMSIPKAKGFSRSFVIATDGYIMVEEQAFRYIEQNLNKANFFAFGIGSSVNRHLIEGMAHVGRGEPFIAIDHSEAREAASKLRTYIEAPVLTGISVTANNIEIESITPSHIPDLLAERPIHIFGKYKNNEGGELTISGLHGNTEFNKTIRIPDPEPTNASLSYLYARERLRSLSDLNTLYATEERKAEIVDLGLKYNLLTEYTSFIAVDDIPVTDGNPIRKSQKLPLPHNVSKYAVGFAFEMEPTVEDPSPRQFIVDVECKKEEIKLLAESVLELWFQKLTRAELFELEGLTVTVRYDRKLGLVMVKGDTDLWDAIHEELDNAISVIGLFPPREEEITITTSIFEGCK